MKLHFLFFLFCVLSTVCENSAKNLPQKPHCLPKSCLIPECSAEEILECTFKTVCPPNKNCCYEECFCRCIKRLAPIQ
ncbi:hypothetical protein Avbf_16922 [Armadillidium vulgare]|nr:hypothetical protein Avbf_16922 [Armadillidium vulgare]